MSFCSYSRDAAMFDATPIENRFLLEFMPGAPEGFVRVYLYVRMLCAHPEMIGGELADVAKALHMEEDEVLDALQYWEQQGLVEKLQDRPALYQIKPVQSGVAVQAQFDAASARYREFNSSLKTLFGEDEKIEPRHFAIANDWMTMMGFTEAAALKLVEYELRLPGGRKPASVFKRANERAVRWAEQGVSTVEDVDRAIAAEQKIYSTAADVLRRLSIRHAPTVDEFNTVQRWMYEWGLSRDDMLAACAETTKSREPTIGYLDAILRDRVEKGSVHFDAAKELLRKLGAPEVKPTPELMRSYGEWLAAGFEPEVLRLAAAQCARKGENTPEKLERRLQVWGAAGIHTQAEVDAARREIEELGAMLRAAGLSYQPGLDDLPNCKGWRRYAPELIRCAAELARGKRQPVQYMDKLLSNWAQAGISTPEAARAESQRHRPASAQGSAPRPARYLEHDYSKQDFGKGFFYDLDGDSPEEGENQ